MSPREGSDRPPDSDALGRQEEVRGEVDGQTTIHRGVAIGESALSVADSRRSVYQAAAVCGLLLLAVGLVFGQTVRYDFINFDDTVNVYLNPHVTGGLTVEAAKWAFAERYAESWVPMTTISHMLDCQFYGLNAGGHHLTNVLLHAATAVLLFLVLRQMTGRLWPSAFVAAVFAVHPLRVESVAWVTERKDVLSGLFFVLTLGAYVYYVRRPFSLSRYLVVFILFALGLMAKPMLVTLPFVLLLLDYWPLGRVTVPAARYQGGVGGNASAIPSTRAPVRRNGESVPPKRRWRLEIVARLVVEKLPLLALSVFICLMTVWSYGSDGLDLFKYQQHTTLLWRVGNVLITCVSYLGMFAYPADLAFPYPAPSVDLSLWRLFGALFVLAVATSLALVTRRRCPYLLVGWLWYLGMLVPPSGIVQHTPVMMADRFTYLPQIGLCIALTWGLADALQSWASRRAVYGVVAALLLAIWAGCAWRQAAFWRDDMALWNHTLACTTGNALAHQALANTYMSLGQMDKAVDQYQAAIAIVPDHATNHYNLGVALAGLGRTDEAVEHYQATLQFKPDYAEAHNNLGNILLTRGQLELALSHFRQALSAAPRFAEARCNAGNVWYLRGRFDDAIAEYRQALEADPDYGLAHYCLGIALAKRGRLDEAITEYRMALATKTELTPQIHNTLGRALVAHGQPDEAVGHFREALAIQPDFVEARRNLDRVLARGTPLP
jgi:protein O-mannosyl-transferase